MLLISTRSVLDVIESFLEREPVDKIATDSWHWSPAFAKHLVQAPQELVGNMKPPIGATSSGEYDLQEIANVYESPKGFKIRSLMVGYSSTDFLRQGNLDLDLILSSTVPAGAVLYKNEKGEETNAFKDQSWLFTVPGLSYSFSPGLSAVDAHLSIFGPLIGQDTPLVIRFGLGAYRHDGETDKRVNAGISIGRGFGLLYGEFKFDRSYVARSGGRLHGRWAPSLGVKALFPSTWISRPWHKTKCN
jgi:hypothetical protein